MAELIGAGQLDRLDAPDRARAQRLATDTLRGMERADRVLKKHLNKVPPLTVLNALRLGTVELCNGGAAHGVVNDLVQIISRHKRYGHLKGLVNAVLIQAPNSGPPCVFPVCRNGCVARWPTPGETRRCWRWRPRISQARRWI